MKVLTNKKLKEVLKEELRAKDARFHLKRWGNRASGTIVSRAFVGRGDSDRQVAVLDALERRYGADGYKLIGMLLAFTPYEWDFHEYDRVNDNGMKPRRLRK